MTILISVSVNGNYKVAVSTKYGTDEATSETISGRGRTGANTKNIPFFHGSGKIVTVVVGPEQEDNG